MTTAAPIRVVPIGISAQRIKLRTASMAPTPIAAVGPVDSARRPRSDGKTRRTNPPAKISTIPHVIHFFAADSIAIVVVVIVSTPSIRPQQRCSATLP